MPTSQRLCFFERDGEQRMVVSGRRDIDGAFDVVIAVLFEVACLWLVLHSAGESEVLGLVLVLVLVALSIGLVRVLFACFGAELFVVSSGQLIVCPRLFGFGIRRKFELAKINMIAVDERFVGKGRRFQRRVGIHLGGELVRTSMHLGEDVHVPAISWLQEKLRAGSL